MKYQPVSEEMKAQIAPFKNKATGLYDIDAVRAEQRKQPRERYQGIFAGMGDDDQIFEHNMISAAMALNEEVQGVPQESRRFQMIIPAPADDYGQDIVIEIVDYKHEDASPLVLWLRNHNWTRS